MREKQWIAIDKFKRNLFIKNELKRFILKNITKNDFLLISNKYYINYKKNKLIRWSNINQQVNKCVKTGRTWSVLKLTRYSRFVFRKESNSGNIPGFRRASW